MRAALTRMARARADARQGAVLAALRREGVDATRAGDTVVARGPGLMRRWARDLALREAGRGR